MDKQGLSISLSADLAAFRRGMSDAVKITKGTSKAVEDESKQMVDALVKQFEKIAVAKSFKAANLQTVELVRTMKLFGMEGSAAFREVVKTAGKLQDEMQDTKGLIDAAAPGGAFKAFAGTLQGVAQGFAGVQGAMALFGAESQDVQKVLLKVQAAMALAEGFKSVEALRDGFTQMSMVIKTKVVGAFATLKGAMIATGIGALIVAIGTVIYYFQDMADEAEKAAAASKKALEVGLKFANDVNELNQQDMELELTRAKLKGASETQLFNIRKKYSDMYIKLLQEQGSETMEGLVVEAEIKKEQKRIELERLNTILSVNEKIRRDARKTEQVLKGEKKGEFQSKSGLKGQDDSGIFKALNVPEPNIKSIVDASKATDRLVKSVTGLSGLVAKTPEQLAAMKAGMDDVTISGEMLAQSMESAFEGMAMGLGEALGGALAGEAVSFGDVILKSMADFMGMIGKAIIMTAIAVKAFRDQIIANPLAAVAAGVALVAGGAYINAKLKEGPKFAGGGIVDGFSNTGDKVPAMVNSGEMILNKAQQANLFKMVSAGGSQIINVVVSGKFTGRDLALAVEQGQKQLRR